MNQPLFDPDQFARDGRQAGCAPDQMENFIRAGILLQPRQLAASAAARLCDQPPLLYAQTHGGVVAPSRQGHLHPGHRLSRGVIRSHQKSSLWALRLRQGAPNMPARAT